MYCDAIQEKYGQFYGGDCYVMLYTYLVGGRESYLIYFWQVSDRRPSPVRAFATIPRAIAAYYSISF